MCSSDLSAGLTVSGGSLSNAGAALVGNVTVVTASNGTYTVLAADHIIVYKPTSDNVETFALPAVASSTGRILEFKDGEGTAGSTNTMTLDPNGAETIDGAATLVMNSNWQSRRIVSDGTQWLVLN